MSVVGVTLKYHLWNDTFSLSSVQNQVAIVSSLHKLETYIPCTLFCYVDKYTEIIVAESMLLYFSCKVGDVQLKALVGLLMVELPSPCQGASLDQKGSVFEVVR